MPPAQPPIEVDFLGVLELLHHALGDTTGRLHIADTHLLGGVQRPSHYRMSLIARALRQLGWERTRYRIDGKLTYMYAKGTRLQRETVLRVSCDDPARPVVTSSL